MTMLNGAEYTWVCDLCKKAVTEAHRQLSVPDHGLDYRYGPWSYSNDTEGPMNLAADGQKLCGGRDCTAGWYLEILSNRK